VLYHPFQGIFMTGDGFTIEQKHTGFAVYYGDDKLSRAGNDYEYEAGAVTNAAGVAGTKWEVYHAVDPDDQAITWLLEQYAMIPRPLITQCTRILMADYWQNLFRSANPEVWMDDSGNPVANRAAATQEPLPTSYTFDDNVIAMRATNAAGAGDSRIIPDRGSGTGEAPLAVNRLMSGTDVASPTPDMSMFENHATHEMGHAVGSRSFTPAPTNGTTSDDYTKAQYGFDETAGTAEGHARTLGFTAAMDANTYEITDTTGAIIVPDVPGSVIRDMLTDKAEGIDFEPAELVDVDKFPTFQAAFDAIGSHAVLKDNLLYKTVKENNGNVERGFYFPFGLVGGAAEVHFYAEKYGESWTKFDIAAWNEKPSHYALSAHFEFFAESFAAYFTGGNAPAKLQSLFTALAGASEADFAAGGGGGGGAGVDPEASAEASQESAAAPSEDEQSKEPAPLVPPIPVGSKRPFGQ
jgi:hypothetical protein